MKIVVTNEIKRMSQSFASSATEPVRRTLRSANRYPPSAKSTAIVSSRSGYIGLIGVLQYRHFPRRKSHEKRGKRSKDESGCLQFGHSLLPVSIPFFLNFNRSMITEEKLPKRRPNIKRKTMINICILKKNGLMWVLYWKWRFFKF